MKKRLIAILIVLLIPVFTAAAGAAEVKMDEAALREFIKTVIRENPELIYETINEYVKQMREKRQEEALEGVLNSKPAEDAIREHNPVAGADDAAITLIEYTDFECPYCARASETVDQVLGQYAGKVRRVFKNNPLKMHENAMPAAIAALAAGRQDRFWEYHDRLFAESDNIDADLLISIAEDLGLDMEKFNRDRQSEEIVRQMEQDMADAAALGFTGTPAFVINGLKFSGARPYPFFAQIIDHLLKKGGKSTESP